MPTIYVRYCMTVLKPFAVKFLHILPKWTRLATLDSKTTHSSFAVFQEQLKQEVASLQKQLASQKKRFEEEAKSREHLQEEHEKELRHLKRDIKHKQVQQQDKVKCDCSSCYHRGAATPRSRQNK